MATDSSDRTREEGDGRNRWRQMIAQEGNERRESKMSMWGEVDG